MNQKGFATLEVILMITVLGILSAIAIPRFTSITTSANTAKVQADLSTLDSAIALYQMDNGTAPSKLSDLDTYVQDVENLKSPSGNVYVNGEVNTSLSDKKYEIKTDNDNTRAYLDSYTSENFTKTKSSNTTTTTTD